MTNKVNYDILNKFTNYDELDLEFNKVTSDIRQYDIEHGIDVIFKYYRRNGFPHYTIREEEKHQHMRKLRQFNHKSLLDGDVIIQTMHALRLAWTYFEPHFWKVRCGGSKRTAWENFHDDEQLRKIIRKTWVYFQNNGNHESPIRFTVNRFRQLCKFYEGQTVSNFRPTAAKVIYETYGGDGVVWDMSTGWGGRLIGALSTSNIKKYIGTDPSTVAYEGACKIKEDFSYIKKEVELHKLGSEVFKPKEKVDLCFTSPPYFDTEKYSDEDTQSYLKYPEEQKWINGFLFKTIENCYESLKKNGYLLLNIANTSSGKNIEEGTLKIAKGFNLKHEKTLKLSLTKLNSGFKYEPIYVFKK
jgi:hypothetical protein|tara:strand:- start:228 stop:1298 length:1071 start_codon:yes stop_codon:yes gene_type:complete